MAFTDGILWELKEFRGFRGFPSRWLSTRHPAKPTPAYLTTGIKWSCEARSNDVEGLVVDTIDIVSLSLLLHPEYSRSRLINGGTISPSSESQLGNGY